MLILVPISTHTIEEILCELNVSARRKYCLEFLVRGREARIKTFSTMRAQANPGTPWGITTKESGVFVGTCGLFAWNSNWRKCSVGYNLIKEAQGHGYMQEALTAALFWGFQVMELNRIEAQVHPNNQRSIELLRRLGFIEEGRLRQAAYWANQYHDMLQFSLLRVDWKGNNATS